MVDAPVGVTFVNLVEGEKVVYSEGVDGSAMPDNSIPEWDPDGNMVASPLTDERDNLTSDENLVLPRQVGLGQNTEIQAVGEFFIIDNPTTPGVYSVAPFSIVTEAGGSQQPIVFNFAAEIPDQVVQSVDSETLSNTTSILAEGVLNTGGALVSEYVFRFAAPIDAVSVEVRRTDENGPLIYTSDFTVDVPTAGVNVTFPPASLPVDDPLRRRRFGFFAGTTYHVTFTSPNGTPQLLGDTNGVAYYARTFQPFTISNVLTSDTGRGQHDPG